MEFDRQTAIRLAVAAGVTAATFMVYRWISEGRKWVRVGSVSKIWLHPIKSTRRHSVSEANCTPCGPVSGNLFDRRLVVVDPTGRQVTAREVPKLLLIHTEMTSADVIVISMEGSDPFQLDLCAVVARSDKRMAIVWSDVKVGSLDCGDGISEWLCNQLGQEGHFYRLLYLASPRRVAEDPNFGHIFSSTDVGGFVDLSSYMFMCDSSVADLNAKTDGLEVLAKRFRPNLMISGTDPFDEDFWDEIKVGDSAEFRNVKPCTRCIMTTIDPDTGEKQERSEPLRTLRSYRSGTAEERKLYNYSPMMGINAVFRKSGAIRIGDPVYVTYKESK